MSSDFERFLREARETLPEPQEGATREARDRALAAAFERKRRRFPAPLLVGIALVLAVVLGIGIGAVVTPSGSAAEAQPAGFGFLPERGWYVLQSGTRATPERPAVAIAANVPISPDDGQSIVPYSTLRKLPPDGVVIVANFTGRVEPKYRFGAPFPEQKLPLQVRDATPYIEWGGQIRPEQPLAQHQLRADVDGYSVDIHFYFGTPEATDDHLAAAQRQLDRLVVQPSLSDQARRPRAGKSTTVPSDPLARRVDRTVLCRTVVTTGPLRDLNIVVNPTQETSFGKVPAHISVTSGRFNNLTPDLVGVRAAGWRDIFKKPHPAGVFSHAARCDDVSSSVRLSHAGLPGPPAVWGDGTECGVRGHVLVRVQGLFRSTATWRRVDRTYFGARGAVREAKLAVVDQRTRKPLAYAELGANGTTRFWKASRCT